MIWLARKLDTLIGTPLAAMAGMSASQTEAYLLAYEQRLGGHRDQALRDYELVLENDPASPAVDTLYGEYERLRDALDSLANAGLEKPVTFFRVMDQKIAETTLTNFTPALPFNLSSVIYIGVAIVLVWLLYETVKSPFTWAYRRNKRTRQMKRRAPII